MSTGHRFFNGTVISIGTTVTKIVGISYKDGGNWVDVTEPEDANRIYELASQSDLEVQLKYKGSCSLVRGAKHTGITITWSDGTTSDCPGTWQIGPIDKTGDWDAPVTGTVTLRPTVPAAA